MHVRLRQIKEKNTKIAKEQEDGTWFTKLVTFFEYDETENELMANVVQIQGM